MEHISKLADRASKMNSATSLGATSMPDELPLAATAAVLAKFSRRYLHKWDSAVRGRAKEIAQEWSERLAGLTPEQISRGLNDWAEDWPPTCDEFRKACLGQYRNSGGDRSYCPTYNGPTYERETDPSRLLSNSDRDAARQRVASKIHQLGEALKGRADYPQPEEQEKTDV